MAVLASCMPSAWIGGELLPGSERASFEQCGHGWPLLDYDFAWRDTQCIDRSIAFTDERTNKLRPEQVRANPKPLFSYRRKPKRSISVL